MGRQGEIQGTAASWLKLPSLHHCQGHISRHLFKRVLSLLSPEMRPACRSQRNTVLGSACQQHLGTARAALLTQVTSQRSSKGRTLSCPQSYPTATQLGDAKFWAFLFRNLFRDVAFHSASSWFDTRQKLCPRASTVTDLPRTRIPCHKNLPSYYLCI